MEEYVTAGCGQGVLSQACTDSVLVKVEGWQLGLLCNMVSVLLQMLHMFLMFCE